jgi:hypothetical protein
MINIHDSHHPITVQGITKSRTRVTKEGTIEKLGVEAYYDLHIAANILSYNKLLETHHVKFYDKENEFIATPFLLGPTLIFTCTNGHYTLNLDALLQVYVASIQANSARYTKRQLLAARKAYEAVQRGSISNLGFTRADLVNAQDIYGTPAAYQLGLGIVAEDG